MPPEHPSRPLKHAHKFIGLYHQKSSRYHASSRQFLQSVETLWKQSQPHYEPKETSDKAVWYVVRFLRVVTDLYFRDDLMRRAVMLETVAAVPGIVAGFHHHMKCLREMEHDHWIKITMDEAENERMHLISLMEMHKPTAFGRALIIATQGIFFCVYSALYLTNPRLGHRFTGYLEEEAVMTYTHFLKMIEEGKIENQDAPAVAKEYWGLPDDASLKDLIMVIRADEADHRLANHLLADIEARKESDYFKNDAMHNPWQLEYIKELNALRKKNQELHPEEIPVRSGKDEGSKRADENPY